MKKQIRVGLRPRQGWIISTSSPFGRRYAGGGSPSPCWWWRRCRARWWGRPSRTGWGSLGGERGGQSRAESFLGWSFTCGGWWKASRSEAHHLPVGSQRVQQWVGALLGEVWVGAEPEGAGQQGRIEGRPDLRHLGSRLGHSCWHRESLNIGADGGVVKDKERSVKSLGLWLE